MVSITLVVYLGIYVCKMMINNKQYIHNHKLTIRVGDNLKALIEIQTSKSPQNYKQSKN